MCYSAEVWEDYRLFVREFGAVLSIKDFFRLVFDRQKGPQRPIIPKGMELAFLNPATPEEQEIHDLIEAFHQDEAKRLEAELFKQKTRLTNAERTLESKETKKALNDQRIATDKISNLRRKLSDLKRTEPKDRDNRIFPGSYAPVMISEGGQRVIKPMRYQCRPAGKPAFYDRKYPGTYNARRDNLQGFWKGQFGHTHGLIVVNAFSVAWTAMLYRSGRRRQEPGERRRGPIGLVQDLWFGVELNPTWRGVDLKVFAYQPSLIGLSLLNVAFAWAQWEQQGSLTPQMIAYQVFWWLYMTTHYYYEQGVLSMWDVIAEKFGFMLLWGDLVLVPFFYCIGGWWLLDDPRGPIGWPALVGLVGLHLLGLWIFRGANAQKDRFKRDPNTRIWGRPA